MYLELYLEFLRGVTSWNMYKIVFIFTLWYLDAIYDVHSTINEINKESYDAMTQRELVKSPVFISNFTCFDHEISL